MAKNGFIVIHFIDEYNMLLDIPPEIEQIFIKFFSDLPTESHNLWIESVDSNDEPMNYCVNRSQFSVYKVDTQKLLKYLIDIKIINESDPNYKEIYLFAIRGILPNPDNLPDTYKGISTIDANLVLPEENSEMILTGSTVTVFGPNTRISIPSTGSSLIPAIGVAAAAGSLVLPNLDNLPNFIIGLNLRDESSDSDNESSESNN